MSAFTWKHLLTTEDLNEGLDESAEPSEIVSLQFLDVPDEVIPVVRELLESNEVETSFYVSFLSKNRMIYGMTCKSKERAIKWLEDFSSIYSDIIAVKCKLCAGIALLVKKEELAKN